MGMEEDATGILQFMATNRLVANPNKTVFMMMNTNERPGLEGMKIKVRTSQVTREKSTKLN